MKLKIFVCIIICISNLTGVNYNNLLNTKSYKFVDTRDSNRHMRKKTTKEYYRVDK